MFIWSWKNLLVDYPHEPKYRPPKSNHNHCAAAHPVAKRPFCYTTDTDKRWEFCRCKTSCGPPETTTNTTIITTASTMTTTSTSTTSRTPSKTCGKNFGDLEFLPKYPKVSILSSTGQIKQRKNSFPGSISRGNTLSQWSKLYFKFFFWNSLNSL